MRFMIGLDGMRVHACTDGVWYDANGELLYDGDRELIHLGMDGVALASGYLVDLTTGDELPITGLPPREPLAVRATQDGFLLALAGDSSEPEPVLFQVDSDGAASLVGTYPPPPEGQSTRFDAALTPTGALYQFSSTAAVTFEDTIIRRTIEGDSELIYTEADDPIVKIHISSLVTGP